MRVLFLSGVASLALTANAYAWGTDPTPTANPTPTVNMMGGSGGSGGIGNGGAGGNSRSSSRSGARSGSQSNASVGGYNGSNTVAIQQGDTRPSVAFGGDFPGGGRCPGTGANAGGSGLVGALIGYSSYSVDCAAIERAEFYRSIGDVEMGAALLRHHFKEDQEVYASLHPTPVSYAPSPSTSPAHQIDCNAINRSQTGHRRMTDAELSDYRRCHSE